MSAYTILSLDLGTNTGWLEVQGGKAIKSGVLHLPGPAGHAGNRPMAFSNWLQNFKHVDEIFYEDVPRFESLKAAMVYCSLLCIVHMFCLQHGITYTNIKSNSVKKDFTGNGSAKKEVMCETLHRMGWKGGQEGTDLDHDECDAIACAWVIFNRREEMLDINELKAGCIVELKKRKFA